jgi:hypothetical protein
MLKLSLMSLLCIESMRMRLLTDLASGLLLGCAELSLHVLALRALVLSLVLLCRRPRLLCLPWLYLLRVLCHGRWPRIRLAGLGLLHEARPRWHVRSGAGRTLVS